MVCDRLAVLIVVWRVACVLLVIVAFESGAGLSVVFAVTFALDCGFLDFLLCVLWVCVC